MPSIPHLPDSGFGENPDDFPDRIYIYRMKQRNRIRIICVVLFFLFGAAGVLAQNKENWTSSQLMEPAQLAQRLKEDKDIPVIISVGPGALIPQSFAAGPVQEKENLARLNHHLDSLEKNTELVIYCGCCPFEHCPNIRPAIDMLQKMQFTRYKLLNLSHNIKADWLDKGYPRVKL